jgi:subtilisin family serine protease
MIHRMGFAGTLAFFLTLLSFAGFAAAAGPRSGDYVPGELLVKFKPGARAVQKTFAAGVRMRANVRTFERLGIEHWKLPEGVDMQAAMDELRTSGAVEFVEPNYRRYLRVPAATTAATCSTQWALTDMDVDAVDVTGSEVTIAVIDTGVDKGHPDIKDHLQLLPEDKLKGLEQVAAPKSESWWHGTAVAGAAAGESGVAKGATILPLRVKNFWVSEILAAYDVAMAQGVDIINASWGGPQFSFFEAEGVRALEEAGILLVAAAGNYEMNNDLVPDYPSGLPNSNILAVAASTGGALPSLTPWSHYGAQSVDIAAPGQDIRVAMPVDYSTEDDDHGCSAGTSFSSPHVAGIAALIKSKYPGATYREMKARILAGAEALKAEGLLVTDGRANANKALTVEPEAVVVYMGHTISDFAGDGDGVLEPGETAQLTVTLENLWSAAGSVSVTLESGDRLLQVTTGAVDIGAMPDAIPGENNALINATATATFTVELSSGATGYHRIPMKLEISVDGGAAKTRRFMLEVGALSMNTAGTATIQRHDQDDIHVWTFHLRNSLPSLQFDLEAAAGDLDLYVKRGGVPQFDSYSGDVAAGTWSSVSSLSRESIQMENAAAGVYHVAVFNWDPGHTHVAYTLRVTEADIPNISGDGGGGGGGGGGAWLAVLAFAGWLVRRIGRARPLWFALPLLLAGCASAQETPVAAPAANPALELLITVDEQADPNTVQRRLIQEGARVLHVYEHVPVIHIVAPAGLDLEAAQARFGDIPGVVAVEPNVRRRLY